MTLISTSSKSRCRDNKIRHQLLDLKIQQQKAEKDKFLPSNHVLNLGSGGVCGGRGGGIGAGLKEDFEVSGVTKKADPRCWITKLPRLSKLEHQLLRRMLRTSAYQSHFTGQRHCRRQGIPSNHVLVHYQGTSLTITRS
ncbi:hypothetical protein C5167_045914 [Papaver somniferum]|uniref:Uncharacterized protein n=1 Tax=Papaver somniferum TaxID=3469 RepID=A0A4Y7LF18_PAPSO|nr:hypothetical protein C5167_045914 [Papaver somniferum]